MGSDIWVHIHVFLHFFLLKENFVTNCLLHWTTKLFKKKLGGGGGGGGGRGGRGSSHKDDNNLS